MKDRIRVSMKKSPKLWVIILVVSAAVLIGAGTLIASQIYKPNDTKFADPVYYSDTMAGGHEGDATGYTRTDAWKSVYYNNTATSFDSRAKYKILEIVPYKGMGELGYLIPGEEPIDINELNAGISPNDAQNVGIDKNDGKVTVNGDKVAFTQMVGGDSNNSVIKLLEASTPADPYNKYKYWGNQNAFLNQIFYNEELLKAMFPYAQYPGMYLNTSKIDLKEARAIVKEIFAKERTEGVVKHIENRIDVLVVDPETLNDHPELVSEANFVYMHESVGANELHEQYYESKYLNPVMDEDYRVEGFGMASDAIKYRKLSKESGINDVEKLVNFEYRLVKNSSGQYEAVPNDISLEVMNRLYRAAVTRKAAVVVTTADQGVDDQVAKKYFLNKVQNEGDLFGGGSDKFLYANNATKLGYLLSTTDTNFYNDNFDEDAGKFKAAIAEVKMRRVMPVVTTDSSGKISNIIASHNDIKLTPSGSGIKVSYNEDEKLLANADSMGLTVYEADTWKDNRSSWKEGASEAYRYYWGLGSFSWNGKNTQDINNEFQNGRTENGSGTGQHSGYLYGYDKSENKDNALILSHNKSELGSVTRNAGNAGSMLANVITIIKNTFSMPDVKKGTVRVLEIESFSYFHYNEFDSDREKTYSDSSEIKKQCLRNFNSIFSWVSVSDLSVERMSIYEFIANIEDINSKYDVIYFGTLKTHATEISGHTQYNSVKRVNYNSGFPTSPVYSTRNNDLTELKYKQLIDFMKAGKVILFDTSVFTKDSSGNANGVDNTIFQGTSNLYQLAAGKYDSTKESYAYKDNMFYLDAKYFKQGEAFSEADAAVVGSMFGLLKEPICEIECTQKENPDYYPVEYTGKPDSPKNTKDYLRISFKIHGVPEGSSLHPAEGTAKFKAALYTDANADGYYAGSKNCAVKPNRASEKVGGCKIWRRKENGSWELLGNANSTVLEVDKEYYLIKDISQDVSTGNFVGAVPWKLEITNCANDSMRASEINYTVVKVPVGVTKKTINVLQINYVGDTMGSVQNCSNIIMMYHPGKTTEDETDVKAYYEGKKDHNGIQWPAMTKGNTDATKAKDVSGYFREDIAKVDEFDVTVDFLDMSKEFYGSLLGTNNFNTLETNRKKAWLDDTDSDGNPEDGTSVQEWKALLGKYNMLIFGFQDMQQMSNSKNFNSALYDFIQEGKSVIFSHDMVMHHDVSGSYKLGKNVGQLRYLCGLDRYNVITGLDATNHQPILDTAKLMTGNDTPIGSKALKRSNLKGAYIKDKGDKILYYPTGNGPTNSNIDPDTEWAYTVFQSDNLSFSKYGIGSTGKVTVANEGQITKYPYDIARYTFSNSGGTATRDYDRGLSVATTHLQYFQLDLEEDDIAVWCCLPGANYGGRYNDGRNNYYIFNRGSITYTGLGHHNSGQSRDEVDLFINTMFAAYRMVPANPYADIKNEGVSIARTGDAHAYNLNILADAREVAGETTFDGEYERIYFNIESGQWPTKYDSRPVYLGVVDEFGNRTEKSGSPAVNYKIYKTDFSNYEEGAGTEVSMSGNSDGSANWVTSGSAVDIALGDDTAFAGAKVIRHKDMTPSSDDVPDYYIELPKSLIREKGVVKLDFRVYFTFTNDTGEHKVMEHTYLNVVPSVLFNLE